MLETIYIIAMILLLFGLTIFVHELGHFLVARWCGLKIEAFSIGFGPAIVQKTVDGIKYKIGALPFGGYVSLPQLDPTLGVDDKNEDEDEEDKEDIPPVTPGRKILVSVAGVIMNMIFAFLIAVAIWIFGMPAAPEDYSNQVGYVDTETTLYEQGLRVGDRIVSVDGEKVGNWKDFMMITALKNDAVITAVSPGGETNRIDVVPESNDQGNMRFVTGVSGRDLAKVLYPVEGSSAEEAGVKAGDLILEFDGEPVMSTLHLIDKVEEARGETVPMVVERDGERVTLDVTPTYDEESERVLIGIRFNTLFKDRTHRIHPGPMEQIKGHAWMIFRVVRALVTPSESGNAARSIGGPFAIFYMFWLYVKTDLMMALWLTALINVNLAIINLLPLPILDGGHIMFSLYEIIMRRPAPPKLVYVLSNIFFVLLVGAMLFLSYRDLFGLILPSQRAMREAPASDPPATNIVTETNAPAATE